MRALFLLALLLPAAPAVAQPGSSGPTAQGSAGPWVDCMRKVGREHFGRRASLEAYLEGLEDQCAKEAAQVRDSLPNVFRLSMQDARNTYAYCIQPDNDDSPRCRNLR